MNFSSHNRAVFVPVFVLSIKHRYSCQNKILKKTCCCSSPLAKLSILIRQNKNFTSYLVVLIGEIWAINLVLLLYVLLKGLCLVRKVSGSVSMY